MTKKYASLDYVQIHIDRLPYGSFEYQYKNTTNKSADNCYQLVDHCKFFNTKIINVFE